MSETKKVQGENVPVEVSNEINKNTPRFVADFGPVVPPTTDGHKAQHAASMSAEALCHHLEDAIAPAKKCLRENLPYLAEAHKRFSQRGRRIPVDGKPTWTEWVFVNLGITDRHVRRLLAEYRQKEAELSDPETAERQRLEAEKKKAEAEKRRLEAKRQKEADHKLTVALAAKAVELAELVAKGDLDGAQKLASTILDAVKDGDASHLPAVDAIPCSGCEQLHSGIAAVLASEPDKPLDIVASECGVSTTVVRQAMTRFNLPPVLSAQAEEVLNVA